LAEVKKEMVYGKRLLSVVACLFILFICKAQDNSEIKIDDLISKMTLEEKISMIHGNSLFSTSSVERLGIPALKMSDGPFGVRPDQMPDKFKDLGLVTDSSVYLPCLSALAATWNTSLAFEYGRVLGNESRSRGKNIILAPGINIQRIPLCGRNFEYFSEDPYLVSRLAVQYIKGIQSQGVAACVKHFALNNQEVKRNSIDVEVDERALREIYLPGFKAAVEEAGVYSVMGAYNLFRGEHCCHNDYLLNQVLKKEWNFKGIVISDWNGCHDTYQAATNGLDIEMGTNAPSYGQYFMAQPLLETVKAGKIKESLIDDKVRRILYVMSELNMLNEAKRGSTTYQRISLVEQQKTALQVAEEAVVLLKNKKALLPLNASKIKSIAVIGANAIKKQARGGGSSVIKARYEVTPLEGLQQMLKGHVNISYSPGYKTARDSILGKDTIRFKDTVDKALMDEAVKAAKASDVAIIVCGLYKKRGMDAEAGDRKNMLMPFGQDELIKAVLLANPRTIVVLISGNPVDLSSWVDLAPALLQTGYIGMEGGNALAEILFGKVNPSGKLAVTYPKSLSDSPAIAIGEYPGDNHIVHYNEGIYVGYRYFDTKNVEPLFCFGYGLSYSKFDYKGLKLPAKIGSDDKEFTVSFDLSNDSKIEGKEVSQLYIKQLSSTVEMPEKELKAFVKTGLLPGETKTIHITVNVGSLKYFDLKQNHWMLNKGKYELLVGSSSRDIRLKARFEIK
jgi:beta-glucosidase